MEMIFSDNKRWNGDEEDDGDNGQNKTMLRCRCS